MDNSWSAVLEEYIQGNAVNSWEKPKNRHIQPSVWDKNVKKNILFISLTSSEIAPPRCLIELSEME